MSPATADRPRGDGPAERAGERPSERPSERPGERPGERPSERAIPWRVLGSRAVFAALAGFVLVVAAAAVFAGNAAPAAADPALEERMKAIAAELRCLVCQNQSIADSHSGLAEDLRRQIREMLAAGRSDDQVMAFMTERYGDFVRYRPPLKGTTLLLWLGPVLLVAVTVGTLVRVLRRRQRLGADAFEPDAPDDHLDDAPLSAR